MSNRNRNSSRSTTVAAPTETTPSNVTSTRSSTRGTTQQKGNTSTQTTQQKGNTSTQTTQQKGNTSTQTVSNATSTSTPRRPRKPVVIRVRSTGEEIRRVPVERSGYRVVRYEGRYHTVRGNRAAPYIFGAEDSDDVLGRA
jgi:hypothetical protein